MTCLIASISFLFFLQSIRVPAQTWYILPLLAIVAVCMDSIFAAAVGSPKAQGFIKVLVLLIFLALTYKENMQFFKTKFTNVDIAANYLSAKAHGEDLVLVNPWQGGVSFNRFYHGGTGWMTVPEFRDLTIFRYDLMKEKMAEINPVETSLVAAQKTLSAGNQVWLLGNPKAPMASSQPPHGTFMNPYLDYWTWQLEQFMNQHAKESRIVDLNIRQEINSNENFPLTVFEGWKE